MIVVVDDERTFKGLAAPNVYCRTSLDALGTLANIWTRQWMRYSPPLTALYLDHDLGGSDTIMPIVYWLRLVEESQKPLLVNYIYVHSMNAGAADAIVSSLDKNYIVKRIPLPECQ